MAKSIQHNVAYVACGSGCASAGGDARCSEGCIGCGACVTACPHGAIALVDGIARVDRSKCTGCGLCGMACPQRVIAFVPGYQNILVRCNNTDKGARMAPFTTAPASPPTCRRESPWHRNSLLPLTAWSARRRRTSRCCATCATTCIFTPPRTAAPRARAVPAPFTWTARPSRPAC